MGTYFAWDLSPRCHHGQPGEGAPIVTALAVGPSPYPLTPWLRLNRDGLVIHGQAIPTSIYRLATRGCLWLHPEDMDDLFQHVRPGEHGTIVYQPVLVAFDGTSLYVEVHPDAYQQTPKPMRVIAGLLETVGVTKVDLPEIARIARQARGRAVPVRIQAQ